MGKYSQAFDDAEKEFDEEFAGKLVKSDFSAEALQELTPEGGPDKEAMGRFIAEVQAAASAQAAKEAWLKLGGKVSVVLLKAAKKAITSGLAMLLLLAGQVSAQPTSGPVPDASPRPIAAVEQQAPAGAMDVIGEFIKSQSIVGGFEFSPLDVKDLRVRGVLFLKGFGFGDKGLSKLFGEHDAEAKTYVDLDFGGNFRKGQGRVELIVNLHVANITYGLASKLPFADRLRMPHLPKNLVGGPKFRLPLPGEDGWTWKNGFRIVAGWQF